MIDNVRHPETESLTRFMKGELPREEAREVVRHLLSGCGRCRRITGAWWPKDLARNAGSRKVVAIDERAEAELPDAAPRYRSAFDRVAARLAERERAFARERSRVGQLRAELDARDVEERRDLVVSDPRFHTWALVESLLEDCREFGPSQPGDAVMVAEMAAAVADRLDEDRYSQAAVQDLRAMAWGQLGNALRNNNHLWDAQKALDTARERLEMGSGDASERCRLLIHQAALYGDRKRYDEAFALLDRVIALAERAHETHLQGNALIRKAYIAQRRDDADSAVELLREGFALIDADKDPRQVLVAGHNLAMLLVESGRYREALARLDETRALHRQFGGKVDFVRFRWLEARVYHGLGWLPRATKLYEEVRSSFIEEGLAYDTALVSLDLAAVYSQEGETSGVRRLAEEMLPIFRSQKAHQEAIAALLFFRDAARRETATVSLIQEVADYLRRSRVNPELRFRAGSTSST